MDLTTEQKFRMATTRQTIQHIHIDDIRKLIVDMTRLQMAKENFVRAEMGDEAGDRVRDAC